MAARPPISGLDISSLARESSRLAKFKKGGGGNYDQSNFSRDITEQTGEFADR